MRCWSLSKKLGHTNYIDIMLVHQPLGDYYGSWRAIEELYDQNGLRGLGLLTSTKIASSTYYTTVM